MIEKTYKNGGHSTSGTVKNMSWEILCPVCRKRYVKSVIHKVKRKLRGDNKVTIRGLATYYGIPYTTLRRAL